MVDALDAVSPLDGRYADLTAPLRPYASEAGLIRERIRVEVTYLLTLADHPDVPLSLSADERDRLEALPADFDGEDARRVKAFETEGIGDRPPTYHDVKAVEYFIREAVPGRVRPWVHYGLTSEDVNNLARRRLLRGAVRDVVLPAVTSVREELTRMAREHRSVPMLSRTHGQPASPTTFGKECAVFASRLGRTGAQLQAADDALQGKCSGATGTYAAHLAGLPEVDWQALCRAVIRDLGFEPVEPTTQVNPGDDIARLFDALNRIVGVCLDCARDFWQYTADGYLRQARGEGVGSSTMPHKVNPIDFENAEGNLSKARSDLVFLSDYLTSSRLQRDLSDSTVHRTVGGTVGHVLIALERLEDGLDTVAPDTETMRADLAEEPAVLAEAVQTALRVAGYEDAYERVKAATQGTAVTADDIAALIREADLPAEVTERLLDLEPAEYTGLAAELADLPQTTSERDAPDG
ncbi:MAG: adenylosuccinate lyase [Halobacteriaceae archaeon]